MKFLVLCLVVAGTWQAVAAAPPATSEVEDQVAEVVDNAKEAVKTMAKQVMKPQDPRYIVDTFLVPLTFFGLPS